MSPSKTNEDVLCVPPRAFATDRTGVRKRGAGYASGRAFGRDEREGSEHALGGHRARSSLYASTHAQKAMYGAYDRCLEGHLGWLYARI